ncbi:Hypothetical predicted protein, partial [Mytilus galloprovincialis]
MPFVKVRPAHDKASKDFRNIDNSQKEELKNDLTCTPSGNESIINKLNCQEKEILKSNTNSVNVESLWKEFRENTTMHGLKHARRENKYQLRWVIWIIALFGMGSLLVYTVYTLFAYYRTNPTLTNINLKFVREMFYPAVTICNMSPYKLSAINASAVMRSHLLHSSRLGVVLPPLDYTNPAYAELNASLSEDWLDKVSFDLDDMFMYCVNERHVTACKNILKAKVTQWGKCFTYNANEKLPKEGRVKGSMTGSATALTFYIDIKQDEYVFNTNMAAGVKIILHDPEEEPDVNNKGFISSPGMSTYVSMKMTKYKYLPAPYKAGGDQYCIDTKSPGFENTLKYQQFYSRTGCQLECRRDFIVNQCGCRAVTDPGNETLCSPIMAATCYYQNEAFEEITFWKRHCRRNALCKKLCSLSFCLDTGEVGILLLSPIIMSCTNVSVDSMLKFLDLPIVFYRQTLWKEFTETTTMHGLRHARKESKYQLRWIILGDMDIYYLLGMGSLLIYMVYTLYAYYRTNSTLTNININFVKAMNYPAVTICNMSPLKRISINASAVMTTHLLHSSRLGVVLPHLYYSSSAFPELNDYVPEDWLNKSSFDLEDMFHYCVNERHLVPCKDILIPKITQWGKCSTFNDYQKVATNGIVKGSMTGSTTALTFYIDVKQDEYVYNTNLAAGVKIVLHDPEEEPDVNNKGFILSPGMSTYVSMKMTKYKYLPAPYKAGGDQYCIDVNSADYVNPLKYYPYYSRAGCLLECRRNYIVEKCGCRAVTDQGNETICTPAQTATCYYQHEVEFDSSGELKEQCKCQISCEFTTFDQSISTALFPADVYYPPLQQIGYTDI